MVACHGEGVRWRYFLEEVEIFLEEVEKMEVCGSEERLLACGGRKEIKGKGKRKRN